jgi:predicted RND superfamily exporter protein
MLSEALQPQPITRESLPQDLRDRYLDPKTGQARVEVFSSLDLNTSKNLERFVRDVQTVAPRATGAPVLLVEAARAIVGAFRLSTVLAAIGIFALLLLVLRNPGKVLLVFLPLTLAGVLTSATMNVLGMSFNLANIIVLPLLIGLGVAFGIYFVLRWAEGARVEQVLRTSMPDAVLLSGMATMISFGSMAVAKTPGMAILGQTLSIALFHVLLCVLVVLPAVLGIVQGRRSPLVRSE